MNAPLVFMDTETTGLSLDDEIWEFAAIRREPDGTEAEHHIFIEHATGKCSRLPDSFREDHQRRFDPAVAVSTASAVQSITRFFHGPICGSDKAHVVGAVPNFDTERLLRLIERHHYTHGLPWHYHLIDVENLAIGYLAGSLNADGLVGLNPRRKMPSLPWDSDVLSLAVGVDPTQFERHTAMGDVRWAMAIYDAVMDGAKS